VLNWDSGMNCVALHVKTDWKSDEFAQASRSRQSENIKSVPLSLREVSLRRAGFA